MNHPNGFLEESTTYAHKFLPGVYAEIKRVSGGVVEFRRVDLKNRGYRETGYLGNIGQVVRNKVYDGRPYSFRSFWSVARFQKFFSDEPARVSF